MGRTPTRGVCGSSTLHTPFHLFYTGVSLADSHQNPNWIHETKIDHSLAIAYPSDGDDDGWVDWDDNCPADYNDDQLDSDQDSIGDACDPTPLPEPGVAVGLLFGGALVWLLWRERTERGRA